MKTIQVAGLVLLLVHPVLAADPEIHHRVLEISDSKVTYEIASGSSVAACPFQLVNHHVLLPIRINGQGPFQVILDTGMPMGGVILYNNDRVEALRLDYLDNVRLSVGGAGGKGEDKPARMAQGVSLEIGTLTIRD